MEQNIEEENRHIEIVITDDEDEQVFKASGNVNRKTSHRFLEGLGYIFIPEEPPKALKLGIPLPAKVSCEHIRECSDYYEKCFKCNNNNAKSYFKPREAEA